jgi:hypothetical protein
MASAVTPETTCMYRMVVVRCLCPASAWMTVGAVPAPRDAVRPVPPRCLLGIP